MTPDGRTTEKADVAPLERTPTFNATAGTGARRAPPLLTSAALLLAIGVGTALLAPALAAPYGVDDSLQAAMLDGTYPGSPAPWDLYAFVTDENRAALRELGALPWWSDDDISLRFFRPLPSLAIAFDHRLLEASAATAHAHSWLWWLALVCAAAAFYRRALPPKVASLATVLFAIAPCHAMPTAWVAARGTLIGLACGVWGLSRYLDWRRRGRGVDGAVAALLFGLAFACGAQALALFGYVLAIEYATRPRATSGSRARGLAPAALPLLLFALVWSQLNVGATGFGFYGLGSNDLATATSRLAARMGATILHTTLGLDHEALPRGVAASSVAISAVAVCALIAVALRWTGRRIDAEERGSLTLFAAGALGATIPLLGTESSPRIVGACVFGFAPLVARFVITAHAARAEARRSPAVALALTLAALGLIVHGGLAPAATVRIGETCLTRFGPLHTGADALSRDAHEAPLLVLASRSYWSLPFELRERGAAPRPIRVLTESDHVLLNRTGDHTLEAASPPGVGVAPTTPVSFIVAPPLRTGEVRVGPGFRATILAARRGVAQRVRFDFDVDFDLDAVTWVVERSGRFVVVPPLGVGYGMPLDQ